MEDTNSATSTMIFWLLIVIGAIIGFVVGAAISFAVGDLVINASIGAIFGGAIGFAGQLLFNQLVAGSANVSELD